MDDSNDSLDDNVLFLPALDRTVCFVVENRDIWFSKEVLSLFSPVFKAMLYGDFKEAKATKIPLPDKSLEDILELFSWLTASHSRSIDENNVGSLLKLSNEYKITELNRACGLFLESLLSNMLLGDKKVYTLIACASEYRLKSLLEKCIQLASFHSSRDIFDNCRLAGIPDNILRVILDTRDNHLANEHKVYYSCDTKIRRCCYYSAIRQNHDVENVKCPSHNCDVKPCFCNCKVDRKLLDLCT